MQNLPDSLRLLTRDSPISRRGLIPRFPSGLTPRPYQPPLLGEGPPAPLRAPAKRLFSGRASHLDAFSVYPSGRGCPAVPCRTTGRLEAPELCSSRTRSSFPSAASHPQPLESDLSRDGLNPAHVPL